MRSSLSWRLTWPLRVLRDAVAATLKKAKRRDNLPLESADGPSNTDLKTDPGAELLLTIFDESHYLKQVPSAADTGITPLEHYRNIGWREGHNPHPLFDVGWYLSENRDVAEAGVEPLHHYITRGWQEARCPSPLFDSVWYLKAYQDVAKAGMEPLTHYLQHGISEGRFPRSIDKELAESNLMTSLKKLPIFNELISERDKLQSELIALREETLRFVPPGHFYSPIPSLEEIKRDESKIFGSIHRNISSIDLHEAEQLKILSEFVAYYTEMPFQPQKSEGLRYFFENPVYSYSDAILLHCMIRFLKPTRIIEVGSGYSSCVTLDTNELFFRDSIKTTFIEPYPELLFSLIKDTDKSKIKMIPYRLQDVDLREFEVLRANDILFIDSTHVSKVNSDVNRIFFEILPNLSSGVYVHFHDMFFPFEYPKEWVYAGRAWNEAYLLKAFLQYNSAYRIVLMNTFMEHFHESFFQQKMPLCLKNIGASIWIRKE